jgi:hypothetical protein
MASRIICPFSWDEEGSVCLESKAAGKGEACHCIKKLPNNNATSEHEGNHECLCGEIYVVQKYTEKEEREKPNALQLIKSVLKLDGTLEGVIPVYVSGQF